GLLWIVEGVIVIWVGMNYFHLAWENLRTLVMLNFVFNSQFRVLIVRERGHFWDSLPGKNLLVVNTLTLIGFTLLGAYGIFVPSVALSEVLLVLGFSAVATALIDFPKCFIFKKLGLLEEFASA
ncbi:MAG TPA: plasma-membrane proton-efflux P-type ATPase, partial [Candidatus Kapabacteria bacterium]|nr:plasma-membrane proton-efflux P-type ATPase [Candidatus Kapabacteria bacterium]